jgi:hypothetical protein
MPADWATGKSELTAARQQQPREPHLVALAFEAGYFLSHDQIIEKGVIRMILRSNHKDQRSI